jgi:hypothetical protein
VLVAEDGTADRELARAAGLRVAPGKDAVLRFGVPAGVPEPYVLRCFIESAEPVAVIDPPTMVQRGAAWPA